MQMRCEQCPDLTCRENQQHRLSRKSFTWSWNETIQHSCHKFHSITNSDDVRTMCGRRAWTTCADDVRMTPGVVLHEIGQLRQVFAWFLAINLTSNNWRSGKSDKRILAWVSAINLTSNNRRSGKSDKRKPSWTALHKDECLTCCIFFAYVHSRFSQMHKIGNIANFVFPDIFCFLLYWYHMISVNVKLHVEISGKRRITLQGCKLHWSSFFLIAHLQWSWQYWHFCNLASLWKRKNWNCSVIASKLENWVSCKKIWPSFP